MNLRRWAPLALALTIGLVVSLLRVYGWRPVDLLDLRALDYRFLVRGPQPAAPEVVIVAVDDASLAEVGRWPWSRAIMAQLIERISAGGPAVIGVDVVQSEPTATCRFDGLDGALDPTCRDAVARAVGSAKTDDDKLADAVRASGRTVLGYFFELKRSGDLEARDRGVESPYAGEALYAIVQRSAGDGAARLPHSRSVTQNLPALAAAARGLGYFNFLPDDDGLYRRAPLAVAFGDRIALPLSLAMLQLYWPSRAPAIRIGAAGVESVRLGDVLLPVDERGQLLINFRGRGKSFRHIPAADVLAGRVPPDAFRDKLVLLGITAVAVGDIRAAAFDAVYPGVEMHASVLDNVLRGQFVQRPAWLGSARLGLADVAVILALTLVLGVALQLVRGVTGAGVALALLAAFLAGSQMLFTRSGAALSVAYPALALVLTYVAVSLEHYLVVDREKRHTRRTLDLYLSPSLARFVSERPEMLKLGGEKSDRTVLFSDIKSFTRISEGLKPEQLVELLNFYLGAMTDIVFAQDGMLDKYIGDGVMAVWGAPVPQADHAARACRAALAMVERLTVLNASCVERGWPPLTIRIGLNSGPMVFGNMGSSGHLSLTVMGDAVNLGARLEGVNKLYGSTIIAGEETVTSAGGLITTRELDLVRVRGKAQATRIYEVLGAGGELAHRALIEPFHAGLAAYRARDWDAAIAAFERAIQARGADGPSELYLRRCRTHQRTPPPPTWDAVTTFEDA
jgi:adenylate cyclase